MITLRLYIAELLMAFALKIIPDGKEGIDLANFLLAYSHNRIRESSQPLEPFTS